MLDAPRQDWAYYEARVREADAALLRSMTPEKCVAIYEELFEVYWHARRNTPGRWDAVDAWQWEEKLAARERQVEAFMKLDHLQRERGT